MKTIEQYISEHIIKGHLKKHEIPINLLSFENPIMYNDIKISIERYESDKWDKFTQKKEMFKLVRQILQYVNKKTILTMEWYEGSYPTLTLKGYNKHNIGWLQFKNNSIIFSDWKLTIEFNLQTDGPEKIAEEINTIAKTHETNN